LAIHSGHSWKIKKLSGERWKTKKCIRIDWKRERERETYGRRDLLCLGSLVEFLGR
jgi:hypothetical protein